MTGWHTQRLCAFDFESTAADPEEARIVTCCIAFVGGGERTEVHSWVADAGVEIPAEAAAIHGFDTARVRAEGKPLADVLPEILGYLTGAVAAGLPLVAYNSVYDVTLADRESRRFGLPPFGDALANAYVIDPHTIDRALDRYRKGPRTLTDVSAHYGVRLDGAHNSTFDALAAARIAWTIAQRSHMSAGELRRLYADRRFPDEVVRAFHGFSGLTLDDLQHAQARWYAELQDSRGTYWAGEAVKRRDEAAWANPPGDESLSPDERRQVLLDDADDLEQRAAGINTSWPIQPLPVGVAA